MSEYQLELKQTVVLPRCRIYRQFIHMLLKDRSIRASGGSGLFPYTVLCSFANFRTSYRRIEGVSYTVYPGEWVCTIKEITEWFRAKFHYQALGVLEMLQKRGLITFEVMPQGRVVKYKITDWKRHNTVLDYNCPCQKDTGFFFLPFATANELVTTGRNSEMDTILDLWLCAVYNDEQVRGSTTGPIVYLRNGTGSPLVAYSDLAARWGLSKATVCRLLKKLTERDHLTVFNFPGRTGTIIYLNNYLSTMFQISDVMIDKEEIAMMLNIKLTLPEEEVAAEGSEAAATEHTVCVSNDLANVSKAQVEVLLQKVGKILLAQGISCFSCPKVSFKLSPLSGWKEEVNPHARGDGKRQFYLQILCKKQVVYAFEMTLTPLDEPADQSDGRA